ncbi:hypothetical protein [Embleya scabrispora]|nr:hypothetical protein [Embleya scabrispora]
MMEVLVRHSEAPGGRACPPRALLGVALEEHRPLPVARAWRGRRGIRTDWWSATTGALVPCGTLGRTHLAMVLDFDPRITGFAAASAEVRWSDGGRHGTITPAFFARDVDGRLLAVMSPWRPGPEGLCEEEIMRGAARAAAGR